MGSSKQTRPEARPRQQDIDAELPYAMAWLTRHPSDPDHWRTIPAQDYGKVAEGTTNELRLIRSRALSNRGPGNGAALLVDGDGKNVAVLRVGQLRELRDACDRALVDLDPPRAPFRYETSRRGWHRIVDSGGAEGSFSQPEYPCFLAFGSRIMVAFSGMFQGHVVTEQVFELRRVPSVSVVTDESELRPAKTG